MNYLLIVYVATMLSGTLQIKCMEPNPTENTSEKKNSPSSLSPSPSTEFSTSNNNSLPEPQASTGTRKNSINNGSSSHPTYAGYGSALLRNPSKDDHVPRFSLVEAKLTYLEEEIKFLKEINKSNSKSLPHPAEQMHQFFLQPANKDKEIQLIYKDNRWTPHRDLLNALVHGGNIDTSYEIPHGAHKKIQPVINVAPLIDAAFQDPIIHKKIAHKVEKRRSFIQKNANRLITGLTLVSTLSLITNYLLIDQKSGYSLAAMRSFLTLFKRT